MLNLVKPSIFALFLVFSGLTYHAMADEFKPVMIYDNDVIMDKSWNEALHNGIKKFEHKKGISVKEAVIIPKASNSSLEESYINSLIYYAKQGYNPIMFNNSMEQSVKNALTDVVKQYSTIRFIVFNGTFDIPNANFFVFSYQEASFLAGYLAAKKSKTNKLGFIGGMDIPLIRNYLCGYIKGAQHAKPQVTVDYSFISDKLDAWKNPEKAYDLALEQIKQGADVIFAAAGASSIGGLKAASDKDVLGIGVDVNQNSLYPGKVLTSVLVQADRAVYMALIASHRNIWREQLKVMGLQEKGVDLAFDEHNAPLVPASLRAELDQLKADIILKKIDLPNYLFNQQCNSGQGKIF